METVSVDFHCVSARVSQSGGITTFQLAECVELRAGQSFVVQAQGAEYALAVNDDLLCYGSDGISLLFHCTEDGIAVDGFTMGGMKQSGGWLDRVKRLNPISWFASQGSVGDQLDFSAMKPYVSTGIEALYTLYQHRQLLGVFTTDNPDEFLDVTVPRPCQFLEKDLLSLIIHHLKEDIRLRTQSLLPTPPPTLSVSFADAGFIAACSGLCGGNVAIQAGSAAVTPVTTKIAVLDDLLTRLLTVSNVEELAARIRSNTAGPVAIPPSLMQAYTRAMLLQWKAYLQLSTWLSQIPNIDRTAAVHVDWQDWLDSFSTVLPGITRVPVPASPISVRAWCDEGSAVLIATETALMRLYDAIETTLGETQTGATINKANFPLLHTNASARLLIGLHLFMNQFVGTMRWATVRLDQWVVLFEEVDGKLWMPPKRSSSPLDEKSPWIPGMESYASSVIQQSDAHVEYHSHSRPVFELVENPILQVAWHLCSTLRMFDLVRSKQLSTAEETTMDGWILWELFHRQSHFEGIVAGEHAERYTECYEQLTQIAGWKTQIPPPKIISLSRLLQRLLVAIKSSGNMFNSVKNIVANAHHRPISMYHCLRDCAALTTAMIQIRTVKTVASALQLTALNVAFMALFSHLKNAWVSIQAHLSAELLKSSILMEKAVCFQKFREDPIAMDWFENQWIDAYLPGAVDAPRTEQIFRYLTTFAGAIRKLKTATPKSMAQYWLQLIESRDGIAWNRELLRGIFVDSTVIHPFLMADDFNPHAPIWPKNEASSLKAFAQATDATSKVRTDFFEREPGSPSRDVNIDVLGAHASLAISYLRATADGLERFLYGSGAAFFSVIAFTASEMQALNADAKILGQFKNRPAKPLALRIQPPANLVKKRPYLLAPWINPLRSETSDSMVYPHRVHILVQWYRRFPQNMLLYDLFKSETAQLQKTLVECAANVDSEIDFQPSGERTIMQYPVDYEKRTEILPYLTFRALSDYPMDMNALLAHAQILVDVMYGRKLYIPLAAEGIPAVSRGSLRRLGKLFLQAQISNANTRPGLQWMSEIPDDATVPLDLLPFSALVQDWLQGLKTHYAVPFAPYLLQYSYPLEQMLILMAVGLTAGATPRWSSPTEGLLRYWSQFFVGMNTTK